MNHTLKGLLLAASVVLSAHAGAADRVTLNIAYQDAGFPALIQKSRVLDGASFDVKWVLLTGPAANLSALYGKAIDLGHMGDTSLSIEQANAREPWTAQNAPLKIVAGWRNDYSASFARLVTAVRTSAHIDTPQALAGHTWAWNYGGYNHAQYLVSLVKAGITEKDIKPIKFNDGASSAAAFVSGQTDAYSGDLGAILPAVKKGDAKVLLNDRDTGIPALGVWTARSDVLADPAKNKALEEYFSRLSGYWAWHRDHQAEATEVLQTTLKLTPERAAYEYQVRAGAFRPFDDALLAQEQKVADALYDGGAIKRKVDVRLGFDGRYNAAQQAVPAREVQ
ncbi:ABC transporter substrate-binding protein [Pseudomonas typographi]|uniref:ABC transporter substrate-binding protein n=1 Tax=Pseudomonas typographi TaxID=2715964 RepID=UPI0016843EF3|nr:ABC transporter substrate-binding protein [Pseudomonas typographi]MBD1551231.1 ABC transporter substrate-binding protein [Pseudomonas typographi]